MKDEHCIFCKIVEGVIACHKVYEDEDFFGFLDMFPVQKGHMLLIPKSHTDKMYEVDKNLYLKLFEKGYELAPKVEKAAGSIRTGMVVEGFGVAHAHLHLIPINHAHDMNGEHKYTATTKELNEMRDLYLNSFK